MNYVAHLFLSAKDDPHKIGSLLADFSTGTIQDLEKKFGTRVSEGIRHHRLIDSFTDKHESVINSVSLFKNEYGIYSDIIVDVLYDHFLLTHWKKFSKMSMDDFFSNIYRLLGNIQPNYPARYKQAVQRMIEHEWLDIYIKLPKVDYALSRISERFSTPTPLVETLPALKRNYLQTEKDFMNFFPELIKYAKRTVGK